ncbi:MAG: CPBP family intramembrane glutamic endopeptidase [Cytophagales bacterium]|nr:CPBP family intramembrane metalloprotease [Bernardetiaceae bacterium]MDW8211630.1 CPBP family intramembrane glutamic endopeptidase [Cytophagales bacterium]
MFFRNTNAPSGKELWISLLLFLPVFAAGLFFFNFLASLVALPLFDWEISRVLTAITSPQHSDRLGLLVVQGIISFGSFLIVPFWFMKRIDADKELLPRILHNMKQPTPAMAWIAAVATVIFSAPLIAWTVKWNEAWQFPAFLAEFEAWAKEKEEELKQLTLFLTNFQSPLELLLGFVVIAIIPGIGEEWLFRGFLQQRLAQLTGNQHVAIWIAAILFSAFHLQFYGFVPRAILGVVFGYLFALSGNLAVPMLAHFFNNAYTVSLMYAYKQNITDFDIENTPEVPPLMAGASALIVIGILLWLHHQRIRLNR